MMKRLCSLLLMIFLLLGSATATENSLTTTIQEVDKYGNIHLTATSAELTALSFTPGDLLLITVGEETITAPLGKAYSDVDTGNVVIRANDDGTVPLIVAVNMGNFAETYGVAAGDEITLAMDTPAGYLDEYNLRQLAQLRTYERDDYASDEVYANFRPVIMGTIGEGVLYRSSSPINNEIARAAFADDLMEAAGVKTVINLADSRELLDEHYAGEDFDSPAYKALDDADQVIALDMGVDFSTDEFKAKLADGLRFMIDNEGPYLFHCNEGKDRAGFVAALLESLMGADTEAIRTDYAESFVNYYHIEAGSEQYDKIADTNILESLRSIAGLEKGADLEGVDLVAAAKDYLAAIGMTEEEIAALESALSAPALEKAA